MSIADTVGEEFAISRRLRAQRDADRKRNGRKRLQRPKSLPARVSKGIVEAGALLYPHREHPHPMAGGPTRRSECWSKRLGARGNLQPCPWVSCKHHLYLDVTEYGTVRLNYPDLEPHQLENSCSLDLAAKGGMTLESVGEVLNVTRERLRQLELGALKKVLKLQTHKIETIRRAFALDDGLDPAKARVRLTVIK